MSARVLVIEDERAFAQVVILNLESEGFTVRHAETGPLGLDVARE